MRRSLATVALTAAVLVVGRVAEAEPITITAGSIQMSRLAGSVDIEGDRGFSLRAGVGAIDGVFSVVDQCNFNLECLPGVPIDLRAAWGGSSLRGGVVTLDGDTFESVGGLISPSSAAIYLTGSVIAPSFDRETIELRAPFSLDGQFISSAFINPDGSGMIRETLRGVGVATLTLQRLLPQSEGLPVSWRYSALTYDFGDTSLDPVPEPGTMILAATGLAALIRRRALRRGRS